MRPPSIAPTALVGADTLPFYAGDIAVSCDWLASLYSDGLRMVTLPPSQRLDLDVPVGWSVGDAPWISGIGADVDHHVLLPRLVDRNRWACDSPGDPYDRTTDQLEVELSERLYRRPKRA